MGGEFIVSTIANQENLAIAKSIHSGLKTALVSYKKKSMTYKAELEAVEEELKKRLAELRMKNVAELYTTNMELIQRYMGKFDVKTMDPVAEKMFYEKLEQLNDELDAILKQYSNRNVLRGKNEIV